MKIEFTTNNRRQLEAARLWTDQETEQFLYGGGKGGGKSFLGASLIFGNALIYPGTHYFIARQELADLRKFTMPTIGEVFRKWGLDILSYAPFNGQDNVYNLRNDSKVFLIPCKELPSDPMFERFGSMQMTRGWIEEAGEVAEAAKANLWLSVGRWNNDKYSLKKKLLITANPKKGWMKREFVDPTRAGTLEPGKRFVPALIGDNPYLPADYVRSLMEEKDPVRKQRLLEGSWDYDETQDLLLSEAALSDAFGGVGEDDGERYMTVDVARFGGDTIRMAVWTGLTLAHVETRRYQSTSITEEDAKALALEWRIPWSHVLVDDDGIGGGVVDHMPGVRMFNAASSPLPTGAEIRERASRMNGFLNMAPQYANLKAQCGWKAAELINERRMSFAPSVFSLRDMLEQDLVAMLRDRGPDSDGRKHLRRKEDVKRDLGRSPDLGDTILMRAWFELRKTAVNEDPVADRRVKDRQEAQFRRNEARQEMNSAK